MFQVRKNQSKKRGILLLLTFVQGMVLLLLSSLAYAEDTQLLVGTWEVYKDDHRSKENIPKEVLSFWADGKFVTSGDHPNAGQYQVDGDTLQLTVNLGSHGFKINRDFEISGQDLKFKNQYKGWVYYRKVSNQPEG